MRKIKDPAELLCFINASMHLWETYLSERITNSMPDSLIIEIRDQAWKDIFNIKFDYIGNISYAVFENEEDFVHFKLKWN